MGQALLVKPAPGPPRLRQLSLETSPTTSPDWLWVCRKSNKFHLKTTYVLCQSGLRLGGMLKRKERNVWDSSLRLQVGVLVDGRSRRSPATTAAIFIFRNSGAFIRGCSSLLLRPNSCNHDSRCQRRGRLREMVPRFGPTPKFSSPYKKFHKTVLLTQHLMEQLIYCFFSFRPVNGSPQSHAARMQLAAKSQQMRSKTWRMKPAKLPRSHNTNPEARGQNRNLRHPNNSFISSRHRLERGPVSLGHCDIVQRTLKGKRDGTRTSNKHLKLVAKLSGPSSKQQRRPKLT